MSDTTVADFLLPRWPTGNLLFGDMKWKTRTIRSGYVEAWRYWFWKFSCFFLFAVLFLIVVSGALNDGFGLLGHASMTDSKFGVVADDAFDVVHFKNGVKWVMYSPCPDGECLALKR